MKNALQTRPSGRFLLRISPALHDALRTAAAAGGMSLNDYCVRKLTAPAGGSVVLRAGLAVVERAAAVCADKLFGVVLYGSWTRDELRDGSDVDVLVVLAPGVPPSRALYRVWDDQPVTWEGRPVEPHFVRLPEVTDPISGLWAEVAIDGVVLFERDLLVSKHLVRARREIAAGRLIRRVAHGQPYWAEVA